MTRPAATPAVLALAATLAFVAPAGTAEAGEYQVYSCRTPAGQVAPTDGWSAPEHSADDSTANTCEAGGGLIAGLDDGYGHLGDSETDKATWAFQAPAGETLSTATLWRAGDTAAGSNSKATYVFWLSANASTGASADSFDECAASSGCAAEGSFTEPFATENRVAVPGEALDSDYLSLNTYCGAKLVAEAPCPIGKNDPSGYAATIELFAADLVLSQSQAPVVSEVAGSLDEDSTVSGTADVAFEATDSGSGIYEVVFRVDGEVVSTVVPDEDGGRCRDVNTGSGLPAFLYTQPCPSGLSVDLPFDTATLSNGTHEVDVAVLDAAGNATTVLKRKLTVDNATAPGGSTSGGSTNGSGTNGTGSGSEAGGTGSEAAGNGSGGSGDANTGATASDGGTSSPAGGASAATASAAVPGPANGTNASSAAALTALWRGHAGERLADGYGAARAIEGRLTAPGGIPIVDAAVEVGERPTYAGASERALGVAHTGPAGRWRLALPRGISSCALLVAYRARFGDAMPAATRTLTLSVRAGLRLDIAPRVVSARGTVRFGGRLLGGPVPADGKQLVLEARSPGGRWLEFHVIRAGAGDGGRLRFAYRFRLAGPAHYQFRVLSEAEADYPFASGYSNVVGVYER